MNRRRFIYTTLIGLVGSQIPIEPKPFSWNPHPRQLEFLSQTEIPMWLYGIPYHQSNGTTGEWLGISRQVISSQLNRS